MYKLFSKERNSKIKKVLYIGSGFVIYAENQPMYLTIKAVNGIITYCVLKFDILFKVCVNISK